MKGANVSLLRNQEPRLTPLSWWERPVVGEAGGGRGQWCLRDCRVRGPRGLCRRTQEARPLWVSLPRKWESRKEKKSLLPGFPFTREQAGTAPYGAGTHARPSFG